MCSETCLTANNDNQTVIIILNYPAFPDSSGSGLVPRCLLTRALEHIIIETQKEVGTTSKCQSKKRWGLPVSVNQKRGGSYQEVPIKKAADTHKMCIGFLFFLIFNGEQKYD